MTRSERERACDEAVLSVGSAPRDYAGAILNACKPYVESPVACVAGISGADPETGPLRRPAVSSCTAPVLDASSTPSGDSNDGVTATPGLV
ncbi:MAG TPA: hypothetical protein VN661_10770 [Candidatus Acidoferrales bacterium]|nr:hypothetical protein [Candidatus Acidoferrales bacterium]